MADVNKIYIPPYKREFRIEGDYAYWTNNITGHKVKIKLDGQNTPTGEALDIFYENNKNKSEVNKLYPYQSLDMKRTGAVRYTTKDDMKEFSKNIAYYRGYTNNFKYVGGSRDNCGTDHAGQIDIFKMKRNISSNYKYLLQVDEQARLSLDQLDNVIGTICEQPINKIFVPYIPDNFNINISDYSDKELVLNNDNDFVDYLKANFPDKLGDIIYSLNFAFDQYLGIETVNLDDMLLKTKTDLYGLTPEQIKDILTKRELAIRELSQHTVPTNDCVLVKSEVLDRLAKATSIKLNDSDSNKIKQCWFNSLHLANLPNNDILELVQSNASPSHFLDRCSHHFAFVPKDTKEGATVNCKGLWTKDNDLNQILGLGPDSDGKFDIREEYMPEFISAVRSGIDAHSFRQFLLGDMSVTRPISACTEIMRSNPFLFSKYNLKDITWNHGINKTVINCVLASELVFPIRIEMGNIDKLSMYAPFIPQDHHMLLGNLLFRSTGDRFNSKDRFTNLSIYYDLREDRPQGHHPIVQANFRSNFVMPGTFNDHVKILYIELNSLIYYIDNMGESLYFYKVRDTDTYYVSKISPVDIGNFVPTDNLVPCTLQKDLDKNIYFAETGQIGGNVEIIPNNSTFDVKFSKNNQNYDDEIFPVNEYLTYKDNLQTTLNQLGDDFFFLAQIAEPLALTTTTEKRIKQNVGFSFRLFTMDDNSLRRSTVQQKVDKLNVTKIIPYRLNYYWSIFFYQVFKDHNLILKGDKILLWSKNSLALDAVLYYQKYVNIDNKPENITVYLQNYDTEKDHGVTLKLINQSKINSIMGSQPLTNKELEVLNLQIKGKFNFAIVDLNIIIKELKDFRNNYGLQTVISCILMSMKKLEVGGNLLLFLPVITNKLVLDLISYIGSHFKETHIEDQDIAYFHQQFIFVIMKDYESPIDLAKLYEINKRNYDCDDSGGYIYHVENEREKELFNVKYNSSDKASCYLNKVIATKNDSLYSEYREFVKDIYVRKTNLIFDIRNLHNNPDNLAKKLKQNMIYSIAYVKKIGIETVDWIDDQGTQNKFFEQTLKNVFNHLDPFIAKLKYGCKVDKILNSKTIKYNNKDNFTHLYSLSESAYKYVDRSNYPLYKRAEKMFNFNQKKLQKMIHLTKGININGQPVSRAWIKLWELYKETKYFDNIKTDTIKAFHICEAPGNFVASSMEYIKRHPDMSQYDWTAQSLYEGDIWDHYGFIENNKKKWDFGKNGSGDITSFKNLEYYLDKYEGVDSLVGDCGLPWSPDADPTKDLSVWQLIYALLLPRKGGNFIIKTYAVNYNLQFLAFLMVACTQYDKLFLFRSSRNFWSPEMYVIGVGNKGLSNEEKEKIMNIAKAMDRGEILYPIEYIPSEFGIEYEYYTQQIINIFVEIKKFFVYLSRNQDKLTQASEDIEEAFKKKNEHWLLKNFN